MFVSVTSPIVLCMYNFVCKSFLFFIILLSLAAKVAACRIERVYASGSFALMENTNALPICNTNDLKLKS